MDTVKLSVYAITGDAFCVAAEDGDKVFESVEKAFNEKRKIELSFLNVEMLTSAFLNTAIGKLYGQFDEEQIISRLSVVDISEDDRLLIKRVTDTAKLYYADPDQFEESIRDIVGDE